MTCVSFLSNFVLALRQVFYCFFLPDVFPYNADHLSGMRRWKSHDSLRTQFVLLRFAKGPEKNSLYLQNPFACVCLGFLLVKQIGTCDGFQRQNCWKYSILPIGWRPKKRQASAATIFIVVFVGVRQKSVYYQQRLRNELVFVLTGDCA